MKQVSSGILENNGALVFAPDHATDSLPGCTYLRVITLRHSGEANGTMLCTFDYSTSFNGQYTWPLYKSTDGGVTWDLLFSFDENILEMPLTKNPEIFEVPQQIADLEPGTLLFSGMLAPADESSSHIVVWKSTDSGATWSYLSTVDVGGPVEYDPLPTSTTSTIWEPRFQVTANGDLTVFYSDERQKDAGVLQALVQKVSTDGGHTWGPLTNVVAVSNQNDRPGMIITEILPDGTYFAIYEVVNVPGLDINSSSIYCKTSPDGVTWDYETVGTPVVLENGYGLGSSPYVKWVDNGTPNGLLVVGSKWGLDPSGNLISTQNFFTNSNLGEGYWEKMPMAVTFEFDPISSTAFSQSIETDIENTTLYHAVGVENGENISFVDARCGGMPINTVTYEAEDAVLTNVTIIEEREASGEKKVGDIDSADSQVLFDNINVTEAGTYMMNIRYNNGSGETSTHQVSVNGGAAQTVAYGPTADWERFLWKTLEIELVNGVNTISFSYDNGLAMIDCIQIYKI